MAAVQHPPIQGVTGVWYTECYSLQENRLMFCAANILNVLQI